MREVQRKLGTVVLLWSYVAAAQTASPRAATIQNIEVLRDGAKVRVQITVSVPVTPQAISASHPDRVVLELPNTLSGGKQERIPVNFRGVRRVRVGLNTAQPPDTHVVVDLDRAAPYTVQTAGNHITLVLSPEPRGRGQGAPAAAVSSPIIGIFRRRPKSPPLADEQEPAPLEPPPAEPPIVFSPPDENQSKSPERQATVPQPPAVQPPAPQKQAETEPPPNGAALSAAQPKETEKPPSAATAGGTGHISPGTSDQSATAMSAVDPGFRTVFKVKYVAAGVAYLDGGRDSGLAEGMKLEVEPGNLPPQQGATATRMIPGFWPSWKSAP